MNTVQLLFFLVLFSTYILLLTSRDPVADQLLNYNATHKTRTSIVTGFGAPVPDRTASLTVGQRGPTLLQDVVLLDELSHFVRERIPERIVHAKGSGAFGYFEVTHDVTQYTKMIIFSKIGKRTRIATRFSTVFGERGSADTVRSPRGFAVKFYTEDGIWDLVGINIPVFFIREPLLFPSFTHAQKRNPVTNSRDMDMFWDFLTLRPETSNALIRVMAEGGLPDGFRHMNGYGCHAFRLVNSKGEAVYAKFNIQTHQSIKNMSNSRADSLRSTQPDYSGNDLYNSIAKGNFPSWMVSMQVMTLAQAATFRWNPFDVTKLWPFDEFPVIPIGKMVLDRNPVNYFGEVEQIAFSPAHMIPGIEPTPDKILQARLFFYSDAQRYRLGPNYLQIPVNCPFQHTNYQRDAAQTFYNQEGAPNYYPNSFNGPANVPSAAASMFHVAGDVARYNSSDDDNYSQAGRYWRNQQSPREQVHAIHNIVDELKLVTGFIRDRAVQMFRNIDPELGNKVMEGLRTELNGH